MISILVACDSNRLIGKNGDLPWHIPEDLKLFKKRTKGHCVVMGRNTWESIGKKPLPDRTNIIISKTLSFDRDEHFTCKSLETALAMAEIAHQEVFIIGGAQIYKAALNLGWVDKIIVSKIKGEYEGDTYFPELGEEWEAKLVSQHEQFDVWEYVSDREISDLQ